LETSATDPEANRLVGSFLCFFKKDWEKGIPMLTLGDDEALKKVARLESESKDDVAIGDAWHKVKGGQDRALYWYKKALPDLSGIQKATIEKLVAELEPESYRNPWDQFDFTRGITVMPEYLRIEKGRNGLESINEVRTKEGYSGGIEITVVARTEKNNIRIFGPQSSSVIFNWEINPRELRIERPNGGDVATAVVEPLVPGKWYSLQLRVAKAGMEIRIAGRIVFSEARKYDLSTKSTVAVKSYDSDIDVKSFVVRPIQ
jgi:hypothetical protein